MWPFCFGLPAITLMAESVIMPLYGHAEIEADDVAIVDNFFLIGNAVHHLVIDRDTDDVGEALIALKARLCRRALASSRAAISASSLVVTPGTTLGLRRCNTVASMRPLSRIALISDLVFTRVCIICTVSG